MTSITERRNDAHPDSYHSVQHLVTEPVCTAAEFKAQIMKVRLTEANWATYEPLLRDGRGGYYAHWDSRSSLIPREVRVWASGEGLLVLMNHVDDRDFRALRSWNRVPGCKWFFNDGRLWIQRTQYLDADKVIDLLAAAA